MSNIDFRNMDCMEGMKQYPDKYFSLAIVDPPFGDAGGVWKRTDKSRFGGVFDKYKIQQVRGQIQPLQEQKKIIEWDVAPGKEYFDELFRVSQNQIIWGANYFTMPPTRCFIVWEKTNIPEDFTMAMCEYAWTSFFESAKIFKYKSLRDNTSGCFHPTEKPIKLYEWLLSKYAKPGDKILDTHVGSASSLIACHNLNFDAVGFEIDKTYYNLAKARLDAVQAQMNIFDLMKEGEE